MPTNSPSALNNPPPLEPAEIATVVCIIGGGPPRSCETMPSDRESSNPFGAPIAYTLSPTLRFAACPKVAGFALIPLAESIQISFFESFPSKMAGKKFFP